MDASVDAPSATTGATAEEVDEVEDVGTTVGPAKSGTTNLTRIVGRNSFVRAPGGTSLMRIVLRATMVSLCRRRHEGMTTINRTKGLGASRSRAPSPASWEALRPRPPSVLELLATDTAKMTRRYFKTSRLAKPLSPTTQAAPAGSPSDRSAEPAADCANQPAADCNPTQTRHRQHGHTADETAVPRRHHVQCHLSLGTIHKVT